MRWYVSIGVCACRGRARRRRCGGFCRAEPREPAGPPAEPPPAVNWPTRKPIRPSTSNWCWPSTCPTRWTLINAAIQREGYAQAIVSPDFLKALKTGPHGKLAVTYFEWAAAHDQKIIIPWRIVDGPEAAHAVAAEIMKAPLRRASRTSISVLINFGMQVLSENPYKGLRRVIDISVHAPNNNGEPVLIARDAALEKGVTINGLPVMVKQASYATMDIEKLDYYYEDCVIGGPGSFVIPIKEKVKFKEAIRTKLILEVAGRTPERPVVPAAGREPRVNCMVGEKIWQDRWGR